MVSMKYSFSTCNSNVRIYVTSISPLEWIVYKWSAVIRDFSRLCGIDVYKVEKSYVWTDVAVRTSSWFRDDNRLVEFLTVHMLLTPLRLVLTMVNPLASRHDKSFVVHILEAAIKRCLKGTLCNFGVCFKLFVARFVNLYNLLDTCSRENKRTKFFKRPTRPRISDLKS